GTGGESFMDLNNRVCGAIERINAEQAGRDVIVLAHGGTIRAAVGLALGRQPEKGLAFDIDNCSVTRLDHLSSANYTGWRRPMVNQQPWIADASHNAMHQPAGPEVKPPVTNVAWDLSDQRQKTMLRSHSRPNGYCAERNSRE